VHRPNIRQAALVFSLLTGLGLFVGCSGDSDGSSETTADAAADDSGFSTASHTKDGKPDYDQVFPENAVRRLDVTISAENWTTMQNDMVSMLGAFGSGGGGGGMGPGEGGPPMQGGPSDADSGGPPGAPPDGGLPGMDGGNGGPGAGGAGGAGAVSLLPRDPVYVESTVRFDGRRWDHVAVRYKGNSSIVGAWSRGVGKLPLRFNFTKLKDLYPAVADQRFWGFKDLALSNINADDSMIREKLANDFLRQAEVPVGRSAFYRVYVDHGEGSQYFGLYTADEIPEDQFLDDAFGSSEGNLYKPESMLLTFDESQFEKKTNETEGDFSDVRALVTALNASRTDAAAWRSGVDATLDTSLFLKWLAANTLMGNWDVYGAMSHNYYLYASPSASKRLTWIAWDHSLAFATNSQSASLDLSNVGSSWPLIRYTMDDTVYRAVYFAALEKVAALFTREKLEAKIRAAHDLVAPYVVGTDGEKTGFTFLSDAQAFETSVDTLLGYVDQRSAAAKTALTSK
jgi:spore coat protein CotH